MDNYYLSTETIIEAYNELTSLKYDNPSILHIFFILKALNINNISFENVSIIKKFGLNPAYHLSGLFSIYEKQPEKCDFINPFNMNNWSNNPTELLNKWVSSRVKNNIIGGATTWREILSIQEQDKIKFTYDYLDKIVENTLNKNDSKIPLIAISIWFNRFTVFQEKVTINSICKDFLKQFKINNKEKRNLFSTLTSIKNISFTNEVYNTEEVRILIGGQNISKDWVVSKKITKAISISDIKIRRYLMSNSKDISKVFLSEVLHKYYQVILSGPPGTSKSFVAKELVSSYKETIHIQFHPQYSYQQFIGGYIVEKTDVTFKTGVLIDLIEKARKYTNEKFLLIIDEINRANTSQVFGDTIQCLDRTESVSILLDNKLTNINLPTNIHIIATMNTTDRSIGALDYALKRRFLNIYFESNPSLLIDLCPNIDFLSLSDFLEKLNQNLFKSLKNRELVIGHAVFLNSNFINSGKYLLTFDDLEIIFNYRILPIIEEYCYGHNEIVFEILGEELPKRVSGVEFIEAIKDFMSL